MIVSYRYTLLQSTKQKLLILNFAKHIFNMTIPLNTFMMRRVKLLLVKITESHFSRCVNDSSCVAGGVSFLNMLSSQFCSCVTSNKFPHFTYNCTLLCYIQSVSWFIELAKCLVSVSEGVLFSFRVQCKLVFVYIIFILPQ